jgi:hypothetical protein
MAGCATANSLMLASPCVPGAVGVKGGEREDDFNREARAGHGAAPAPWRLLNGSADNPSRGR